jgi:hypothetical protein
MLGEELWKKIATEVKTPGVHFGYYDRKGDPIETILEEYCRKIRLTVGKLYDILVKCGAGEQADMYL